MIVDKPKFLCSNKIEGQKHQSDMVINCTVRAQPRATKFQIMWQQHDSSITNTTLIGKDREGHYTSDVILEGVNTTVVEESLFFLIVLSFLILSLIVDYHFLLVCV